MIFIGHQPAGYDFEEQTGQHRHAYKQQQAQHTALQKERYSLRVAVGESLEIAVEAIEKSVLALGTRLKQYGAQSRGKGQRHNARQHHGNRNGDRELPVQLTRQAAQKRHRYKGRAQHQHNGNDRAGDFTHGLYGRVMRA